MRIVFMNYWFSEGMGYAENLLPDAVARLGHDVHVVTSNAQVHFDSPTYARTYESFLGPPIVPCGTQRIGDVTVHRLPFRSVNRLHGVEGLVPKLRELRPDVVQSFETFDLMAVLASFAKPFLRYRLFLESHIHRSVFAPALRAKRATRSDAKWWLYPRTLGRWVGGACDRCYAISSDAAEIAVRYFGIPESKVATCSLGVDTSLFRASEDTHLREKVRGELGFASGEVVCVYTGRFSEAKNPLLLAKAVAALRAQGKPFRGLFVGEGEQAEAISAHSGCVVQAFVPMRELPKFYWASDVGVWPKQESTSQLDAAACGLPVVIGDHADVRERVDGNGAVYLEDNAEDLARVLADLSDAGTRRRLGELGALKMQHAYSWDSIAKLRVADYEHPW